MVFLRLSSCITSQLAASRRLSGSSEVAVSSFTWIRQSNCCCFSWAFVAIPIVYRDQQDVGVRGEDGASDLSASIIENNKPAEEMTSFIESGTYTRSLKKKEATKKKSTKAPTTPSTKAPTTKSTKAPSTKSTKAPSTKSTKAPSTKSTKSPSSIKIRRVV